MLYRVMSWDRPGYTLLRTVESGADYREVVGIAKVYAKPGRLITLWQGPRPLLLFRWIPELHMVGGYWIWGVE